MNVLLADTLPDEARTRLQSAGLSVYSRPGLKDDALAAALAEINPDVLVVRSTRVTAAHVAAAPGLELVIRAGAGTDTIDLDAASARGVYVANCPGTNAVAVAELTWGHILNADRRIADNVAELRAGRWAKSAFSKGRGLKGRTLGVLGFGDIARAVVARARGFEMSVVAWSPRLDETTAAAHGARWLPSAVEVARRADVLTVHVALNAATRGLVGDAIFDALRPGAIFVNTSRGEVVDQEALARAVRDKHLSAGLDVYADEPARDGHWETPLAHLPGVYGTHHIGASTAEAQEAVADEVCRIILTFRRTGEPPNCVNIALETPATHVLVVRHLDRVGVLAGALDRLREAGINVQRMDNIIFAGEDGAACARVQIEGEPPAALLADLRADEAIVDARLVPLRG